MRTVSSKVIRTIFDLSGSNLYLFSQRPDVNYSMSELKRFVNNEEMPEDLFEKMKGLLRKETTL